MDGVRGGGGMDGRRKGTKIIVGVTDTLPRPRSTNQGPSLAAPLKHARPGPGPHWARSVTVVQRRGKETLSEERGEGEA